MRVRSYIYIPQFALLHLTLLAALGLNDISNDEQMMALTIAGKTFSIAICSISLDLLCLSVSPSGPIASCYRRTVGRLTTVE